MTLVPIDKVLRDGISANGAWTREQLALIGVAWPPSVGWKKNLVRARMMVDAAVHAQFVALKKGASGKTAMQLSLAATLPLHRCWSDGACEPNPGNGGWGFRIELPDGSVVEAQGGERRTTSNRMELTAAVQALHRLPDRARAVLYSDSEYVVKGVSTWLAAWKKRGWVKADQQPVKNRDLWMLLDGQLGRVDARFEWVRGHSGNPGNERADELAQIGRQEALDAEAGWALA